MNTLHRERDPEPEGRCIFRVDKVIAEDDCLVWSFIVDRAVQGQPLRHLHLDGRKTRLWNLRDLLEALGIEIPDGPMDLKLNEYVGLKVVGDI